jgi:fucose permease
MHMPKTELEAPSFPHRRIALVAASCAMLVFALSSAILPAALLRAAADLNVDAATLTRVVATQFGAFFLSTLAGGLLSDRFGKHAVLQAGCVLTAAGAILWTFSHRLLTAHAAAAVLGMGGGILESIGSALLADLYPERRKLVLNVTQVAYCAGAAAGPAVMSLLLPQGVSWRLFFAGEALLGVLLLALYRATPAPPAPLSPAAGLAELTRPLRDPSVRLLALALFGYVLAESGLAVGTTAYLQMQHHAPERWAILGITLVWLSMLVGRMICAVLPENLSTERLIAGLSVAGALSLAAQGLAPGWRVSFALFGLSGLIFSGIWPLIVALCVARQPARSGGAVGVVIAGGSLGVVAAPLVVAAFLQGGQALALYPLFALALLGTAVLVRPRQTVRS